MQSIPAEVLQEIKQRVDIVAVISGYVRLRRAGVNYKGLCPFHQEKSPSFHVHPEKRIFHCFGCGAGGDVITFVRKVENKQFPEVVERLAGMAGVDLTPYLNRQDGVALGRIYEAMEAAQEHFRKELKKSKAAQEYLERRGYNQATLDEFGFGFAPESWDALLQRLTALKFTEDEVVEAGLARRRQGGSGCFDLFRNRVTLPIVSEYAKVVGFGARVLGDQEPKYLNSPETPLFNKGRLLFNLHRAAPGQEQLDELMLLEGYMDVVAVHQAGFRNAVAALGTGLTEPQVKLLQKKTKRLVLGYDSDPAGVKATLRALKELATSGLDMRILALPDGLDPDDLICRDGAEGLKRAIDGALPVERFFFDAGCRGQDLGSDQGKERVLRELMPVFDYLPSMVSQQNLIRLVAERFGLSEELVRRSLTHQPGGRTTGPALAHREGSPHPSDDEPGAKASTPLTRAERALVRCFLLDVKQFHDHRNQLHVAAFEDPYCKRIIQRLLELADAQAEGPIYEQLIDSESDDSPLNRFITKEVVSGELNPGTLPQVVTDSLREIGRRHLEARKKELLRLIRESLDPAIATQHMKELEEISRTLSSTTTGSVARGNENHG